MVLNNLTQNFAVNFSANFFYPEVNERWLPVIRRMMLPYLTVEDFMNAQIQSFELPAINMVSVEQQYGRNQVKKRDSRTVDEAMDKSLSITFKLTEGYISYFIMRQQLDLYYQVIKTKPLYWPSINVDVLDDFGHAIITYEQEQLTPDSLSDLQLSYAAKLGSYNTFTLGIKYNFFNIWYMNIQTGQMVLEESF